MENLNINLRLCDFAAIVATILISSSARSVAQANVQNVQVVSTPAPSGSPQTNLPNFSALSTPSDTPPPSTSGSGLSSLIGITPQNSGSTATSASPAAPASPAASATSFVPIDPVDSFQTKFAPNQNVGDGVVNTNPVKPAPSPAISASPATTNIPIQGSQVNEAAHATGTGTGTVMPSNNVLIQGSQANDNAHAASSGSVPITPSKNVSIQGAQVNNPLTGNADNNAGDADNRRVNRHPGHKIKNKGQGQLSNAGAGGDDSGPKLHDGQHKKRERIQTQGQGGNGQRHHHQQQVQSTQPQPGLRAWGTTVHAGNVDSAGDGGKKGKPKPTPTPH